jgi:hypothetical protein
LNIVLFSIFTLLWQLLVLFACCSGIGLAFRFLLPKEFSLLNKVLFLVMGGLFLVVLVPQNLVYLGVPVRISAWLILGAALVQGWFCRYKLAAWRRAFCSNAEIRTVAAIILLTITFHGVVPISQGLEWYYGKGHFDQINYVLLAEFLKEEPYSTSEQDIGLRPWLVRPVGFKDKAERLGMNPGPGQEITGLKKVRIGQSIITAEISVWSGTDAKGGYAATVIFFLALLAICLYVFLRESGVDRFMAASGALLAAVLPAVTRLSLNGFLSQVSILFVFPFFASLLRRQDLGARSFTLFFSLTLAYLVAAYSEIAPIGFCALFFGVIFVRQDKLRTKRLMLMCAILLIALVNPYYLRNLIEFLGQQYYFATTPSLLNNLAPNILTLRGWSELIFGAITGPPLANFFDVCTVALGILWLEGVIFLSGRDRLIIGTILLPTFAAILFLATRTPVSYYAIAKITLSVLPFGVGLVLVALSRVGANKGDRPFGVLRILLAAFIVAAAAAGSSGYYFEVLNNGDLLRYVREPSFLNVCRALEELRNKRVLVFETQPLLTSWLCYHGRHNDVYFDGRLISDSPVPQVASFSKIPDFDRVDFVATRDRIIDLRAPSVSCLTLVDDPRGEDRKDGHVRYWLGPPAGLRFLALRTISANLKISLAPGPEATSFPIEYSLADGQGEVSKGELSKKKVDVRPINLPRGFSNLELSVKTKDSDPNAAPSYPILAELDGIELNDLDLNPAR